MIDEFDTVAASFAVTQPTIPIVSNVTGQLAGDDFASAAYWKRHVREAVRFADSVRYANSGRRKPLPRSRARRRPDRLHRGVARRGARGHHVGAAQRPPGTDDPDERDRAGLSSPVWTWIGAVRSVPANFVELPTYAFERRRFWLSADGPTANAADAAGLGLAASEHALLGAVVELPASGGVVLTGRLSPGAQGWLADHAVGGVVIFPGAGFVELAIRAGDEVGCGVVDELMLAAPLVIPGLRVGGDAGRGRRRLTNRGRCPRGVGVFARRRAARAGLLHAEGVLSAVRRPAEPGADMSVWPPVGAIAVDIDEAYDRLAARGYGYGPAFRGLTAMWRRGDEVFAEVSLPDDAGVSAAGFGVHPALLDAALHAVIAGHRRHADAELTQVRAGAVLLARRVAACRGSLGGAGADRADRARRRCRSSWPTGLGCRCLSVASMVARPVSRQQLMAARVRVRARTGSSKWIWSPAPPPATREASDASDASASPYDGLRIPAGRRTIRWPRCTARNARRAGGAAVLAVRATTRACWWWSPAARSRCRARTSPIWPARRCGGWCARRRPSIPAGSCWWIPMRPLTIRRSRRVLAVGEPQVVMRGGVLHIGRVHGSRAVDALLVPPRDGAVATRHVQRGHIREPRPRAHPGRRRAVGARPRPQSRSAPWPPTSAT